MQIEEIEYFKSEIALSGHLGSRRRALQRIVDRIVAEARNEELARDQESKEESEFRGDNKKQEEPSPLERAQWDGYNKFWRCVEKNRRALGYSGEAIVSERDHQRRWNSEKYPWFSNKERFEFRNLMDEQRAVWKMRYYPEQS